jgi:hypothetical protein
MPTWSKENDQMQNRNNKNKSGVTDGGIGKRQRNLQKEKRDGDRGEEEKISNNTTSPGIPDPGRLVGL